MSNRVSMADLESALAVFARSIGATVDYAAPLALHLSGAYGGWAVHQNCPDGGIRDVFRIGHVSKRELRTVLIAATDGARLATGKSGYVQCAACGRWRMAHQTENGLCFRCSAGAATVPLAGTYRE